MPFTAPFHHHFVAGDLLYGLAPARTALVLHLGAEIMLAGGPATVDQYRKTAMDALRKTDRRDWKLFLRDNEVHPRYGFFTRAIRSSNNDEDVYADARVNNIELNKVWRSKSKFGMEWTISNLRGHIHFTLDNIDMAAVVTKTHRFVEPGTGNVLAQDAPRGKAPDNNKERTITHSELRWIYRNRANPLVQARVQFWRTNAMGNLTPCIAPWNDATINTTLPSGRVMTWQDAWHVYHPTTERAVF